jgi:hypothetical protein
VIAAPFICLSQFVNRLSAGGHRLAVMPKEIRLPADVLVAGMA